MGVKTLFQESTQRISGTQFNDPVIVTNSDCRFTVTEQLREIGIVSGAILIEPESRNTAPGVLAAAFFVSVRDPDAILLIAPSDHIVSNIKVDYTVIEKGLKVAKKARW